MKFSFVSNSCMSIYLYKYYNPNINQKLIDYTNPFISSLFSDDESWVRLCENYDYYTSLEPRFGEPINENFFRDCGIRRFHEGYLAMFLGDVEIQWIHDYNSELLLKKYKGRLELSKNFELLFIWCDAEMFNIHTEKERKSLLKRYCEIKYKKIFLTKYSEEEYEDEKTIIKFVPEWEGKSQYDRLKPYFIAWYKQSTTADMFIKIINKLL